MKPRHKEGGKEVPKKYSDHESSGQCQVHVGDLLRIFQQIESTRNLKLSPFVLPRSSQQVNFKVFRFKFSTLWIFSESSSPAFLCCSKSCRSVCFICQTLIDWYLNFLKFVLTGIRGACKKIYRICPVSVQLRMIEDSWHHVNANYQNSRIKISLIKYKGISDDL